MIMKRPCIKALIATIVIIWCVICIHLTFYHFRFLLQPSIKSHMEKVAHPVKPKMYASFSALLPNEVGRNYHPWSYVFHLPITALMWKKIDFYSVVFIIFDERKITRDAEVMAGFVVLKLLELNAKIIYINIDNSIMSGLRVAQLVRIFPYALTQFDSVKDYLISSDADLYPILKEHYVMPEGKCIHFSRGVCCGKMKFENTTIIHYPMSNIGMTIEMWKNIFPMNFTAENKYTRSNFKFPNVIQGGIKRNYYLTCNMIPLFKKLKSLFGEEVYRAAKHAGPLWYIDQWYLSIQIYLYQKKNSTCEKNFDYYANDHKCIRIDRASWEKNINDKKRCNFDSHVLQGFIWSKKQWDRMELLFDKILVNNRSRNFISNYRNEFNNTFHYLTYDKYR